MWALAVIAKKKMILNKIRTLGIISIVVFSIFACSELRQTEKKIITEKIELTFADTLWINFARALESKNLEYLIQNSLDTIQCAECKIGTENANEFYESGLIFETHLNQLMHLKSLTDKKYIKYQTDRLVHINLKIEAQKSEEGAYNLIYTFIMTDKGFKFKGMIMT